MFLTMSSWALTRMVSKFLRCSTGVRRQRFCRRLFVDSVRHDDNCNQIQQNLKKCYYRKAMNNTFVQKKVLVKLRLVANFIKILESIFLAISLCRKITTQIVSTENHHKTLLYKKATWKHFCTKSCL